MFTRENQLILWPTTYDAKTVRDQVVATEELQEPTLSFHEAGWVADDLLATDTAVVTLTREDEARAFNQPNQALCRQL